MGIKATIKDIIFLSIWREIMAKKKKKKVVKLTDEQYGAYIMALKDERPPKLIEETQKNENGGE
jgi:hypothetical protein